MGLQNTSDFYRHNPELVLLAAMSEGDEFIPNMEAAGQRQLVNSDRLPVNTRGTDAEFEAVGFTFGEPDKNDRLFRPATLPGGWRREGSDHAMWSYIVDELGRRRVAIFYKAAFYDRDAFMHLETPTRYLNSFLWGDDPDALPVLDEQWLTPQVADTVLAEIRDRHIAEAAEWDVRADNSRGGERNRADCHSIRQRELDKAAKTETLRVRLVGEQAGR